MKQDMSLLKTSSQFFFNFIDPIRTVVYNYNKNFIYVSSLPVGQTPTIWGHHLYHSKVDRDLSHEHRYFSEGLQLNALIQEDVKV